MKVQSFFRTGGLQKYFIVNLVDAGNTENDGVENAVQAQLAEYKLTQQEIEEELQTLEAAAKIDKTGWFKRTGWLEFLKDRNLAHVAYQARAPDHNERRLKLAAQLTEGLVERSVKGLATLTQELRRWLRSAKREEPDVRPLARLQNPESQALHAVLEKQTPLIVVLPTGGGKSLLFTLPACVEEPGVTVVVVPYRALIEDLVGRIQQCGVECMEWKHGENNPASVVVVSADVAGDMKSAGNFLGYARMLKAKGLLHRIVIDECHLVFTARHWRENLLAMKNLRLLGSPMVMLTATLPPLREGELEASMLVRHATYIRASTARPNARYFVSWCQRDKLEETALFMCKRWAEKLQRSRQKGVVYCKSKVQCERLATELGCGHYHAGVVDRADRLQEWVEKGGMMVATSALGTGVDFEGIVYILHVGTPWSMSDFAQASGRGGRGGERFEVVVLVEQGEVEQVMEREKEDIDVLAMGQFLIGSGCRRELMSSYLDQQGQSCGEIGAAGCDRCGEGEEVWIEEQEKWTREWAVVEEAFTELREGCAICWLVGQEFKTAEEEQWKGHRAMQCTAWARGTGMQADEFRVKMRDQTVKNNCRRCWVSQKYCATGEGMDKQCQWPNVVVPLAFAARLTRDGIRAMGELGFAETGDEAYAGWLGKRHREEVWGQMFSNAMAMAIKVVVEGWERASR